MKKALVLMAPRKGVVELVEQSVAEPGPNEIQVRVKRSLVSHGTERAWILARENMERPFPFSPGYAVAGVVEAVGSDVARFKVGDRVASQVTHRSVGNISQDSLTAVLPGNVSFDEGVFMILCSVGIQGARKARIELGESVMVLGLGLVGQFSLQFAQLNGGLPVIGVDRVKKRLDLALRCGADAVLDNSDPAWKDRLREIVGPDGPNVVIEATGFPQVISTAIETVAHFGRVVLNGSTQGESTVNFYRDVHTKQVSVIGALNPGNPTGESRPGHWTRPDEVAAVVKFMGAKRLSLEPLITERIGVGQILETYQGILSQSFESMGTMIDWER